MNPTKTLTALEEVVLASPRGFCAGVDRAIQVVEQAVQGQDRPVYVRHQIVHNPWVVGDLEKKGATFVEEADEIPEDSLAIFSAHGVSPQVRQEAQRRGLQVIDATCPLVSKVHSEVLRYARADYTILYVGHHGHPEVVGVQGEAPDNLIVVDSLEAAERVQVSDPSRVAYATQTTLSVDDTAAIVQVLKRRFPEIVEPRSDDICYATQNRQEAVRAVASEVDVMLVVGAANSSNSNRLVEVAERAGPPAHLVGSASDLKLEWLEGARRVGITSGASTPENLVQELVDRLKELGATRVREVVTSVEDVTFAPPRGLPSRR